MKVPKNIVISYTLGEYSDQCLSEVLTLMAARKKHGKSWLNSEHGYAEFWDILTGDSIDSIIEKRRGVFCVRMEKDGKASTQRFDEIKKRVKTKWRFETQKIYTGPPLRLTPLEWQVREHNREDSSLEVETRYILMVKGYFSSERAAITVADEIRCHLLMHDKWHGQYTSENT